MKKILIFIQLFISTTTVNAQDISPEIVSSAGTTFQGNSMQIDWTLGELLIANIENSDKQITQGFHQPIFFVTDVKEAPLEIGQIKIYPNPTAEWIEVYIRFLQERNVQILLYNFLGNLIWTSNENDQNISFRKDISELPNGPYLFIFLIDDNQYSQTFNIQKN